VKKSELKKKTRGGTEGALGAVLKRETLKKSKRNEGGICPRKNGGGEIEKVLVQAGTQLGANIAHHKETLAGPARLLKLANRKNRNGGRGLIGLIVAKRPKKKKR